MSEHLRELSSSLLEVCQLIEKRENLEQSVRDTS